MSVLNYRDQVAAAEELFVKKNLAQIPQECRVAKIPKRYTEKIEEIRQSVKILYPIFETSIFLTKDELWILLSNGDSWCYSKSNRNVLLKNTAAEIVQTFVNFIDKAQVEFLAPTGVFKNPLEGKRKFESGRRVQDRKTGSVGTVYGWVNFEYLIRMDDNPEKVLFLKENDLLDTGEIDSKWNSLENA